jgi:hypothetical protein
MDRSDDLKGKKRSDKPLLSLMVLVGVSLFVAGFMITVSSLSDLGASSSTSDSERLLYSETEEDARADSTALLIGITLSLAGVVAATAGPAAFFIHRNNRSS